MYSRSSHQRHWRFELLYAAFPWCNHCAPGETLPFSTITFGTIGRGVVHREALDAVGIGRLPSAKGDRLRRPGSIPGSGDRGVKISNQKNHGDVGYAEGSWGHYHLSSCRPPPYPPMNPAARGRPTS